MATRQQIALQTKGNREVGNLNNLKIKTVNHGAIVTGADIDQFTLGELGFDANGERTVKQLAAKGNKAYLVAAPEARYMGEELVDFYNAVGERVRVVILEPGYTRFDTSAFTLNAGVSAVANGLVAHFDVASKKYIVSAAGTPHADYATSSAQFVVVSDEKDMDYSLGKATIRLEVSKA
ncbi:hypothetical protein P4V41_07195 [Fictibacillus nanhaiensis]|uniref:hypothetical protein n=1 Tax=Fictibacillus nanhaiensis TaxID=742169 RepID=UPI002E1DC9BF|nr:hypothetical protein [Fictibacillus nanhaiensis]